jgi:bcr-type benzoyl-CoA reductase subunit C
MRGPERMDAAAERSSMDTGEITGLCLDIWRDPYGHCRRLRDKGQRPMAYFCSYAPEEIIHAAGFTPVRLMGAPRNIAAADAHLQAYCCAVARSDLDLALEGELDWLEGAVFVQTCDTMMRLSDIWRLNASFPFHGDISLPVRMGEGVSLEFLREELASFRRALEEYRGAPIAREDLEGSIEIYNRNRQLAGEVYRLRRERPGVLGGLEGTACVVAGLWMRKEDHNRLLEELLQGLGEPAPAEATPPTPLFAAGSVCTTPDLFELARELGADIVDDDFCCGHRYIEGLVELEGGDPLQGLAERISRRINCPAKHSAAAERTFWLAERIRECAAAGLVLFLQNFCEPWLFEVPFLKERMREEGIPTLVLESDLQSFSRGQLRTRLQAFLETIRGI